ncbi:hypothetical protein OR16_26378 [Cupriavidus basilensis OR16]|uniref:Transmembrane protein n=1 Tax=Cupriavidus basilensis OR16 TaxID=1127483 RepID=H1SAW2_9BURK|nr:DUF6216 family protein [Cupriavidus basilensis]EHP40339.1 hypothetical protein OR16_26378 [Cupriavidus basilensis OR16]
MQPAKTPELAYTASIAEDGTRRAVTIRSTEVVLSPPKHYLPGKFVTAGIALLMTFGIAQLAVSPVAYLQMRASKTWFKTDATTVKSPFDAWSFDATDCSTDTTKVTRITGFLVSETDAICKALREDGLKPLVKQTIEFQGWTGVVGLLITLMIVFFSILAAFAAQEAVLLRKRLYGEGTSVTTSRTEVVEESSCVAKDSR